MITAIMVQELREATDAPLMDCKRALVAADGHFVTAAEMIRTNNIPDPSEIRVARLERRVAVLEAALQKLID